MAYHVADASKLEWEDRPPGAEGQQPRRAADVTSAAGLQHSRGRVWRYPAGTRGRRHADKVQEEVFVVISGRLTMLLGDPYERIDVGPESVVAVEPGTPLQVRNESDEELVLYIYGAPPEQEGADLAAPCRGPAGFACGLVLIKGPLPTAAPLSLYCG